MIFSTTTILKPLLKTLTLGHFFHIGLDHTYINVYLSLSHIY